MIESFTGKNSFLSNFHRIPGGITYEGVTYPTVEHAYQAQKTTDKTEQAAIARLETPGNAKRYGRSIKNLRPNWDNQRVSIMQDLLWLKFENPYFRNLLLNTGDKEIVEGNLWHDRFWGVHDGEGENHLGKLLMAVRQRIKERGR